MAKQRKRASEATDADVPRQRKKSEGRSKAAIGERLELTRQALGKNKKDFAEPAGVKQNTYNQYAAGTNAPDLENANLLCDYWGLTLDWIYRGENGALDPDLQDGIKSQRQMQRKKFPPQS